MNEAKLYLIPTPITGIDLNTTLLPKDIKIVGELEYFIVETPKTARSFLSSIELSRPIQEISMEIFDEHTKEEDIQSLIQPLMDGKNMGLMTDAGTPCIADPGEEIVLLCQRLHIQVIPMVGPSSITLALMASGLNAEQFAFHGYLPAKPEKRKEILGELVNRISEKKETQIFIETPYRNQEMFESIKELPTDLKLTLGINIGSENSQFLLNQYISGNNKILN
jgi:16S rRNA (cytidine1402-2'-O)-methyltransferase